VPIRLNGEPFEAPDGATVADLVRLLDLPPDRVAVELDRRIVRRPDWAGTPLQPGAAVEVVQLVGGG
jgi:sulfur carrier protein